MVWNRSNLKVFEDAKIDVAKVLQAKNTDEFHAALSVPLFGYSTVQEYYANNDSGGEKVLDISVSPFSFLS